MNTTLDTLRQHQVIIMRRLWSSPLTEFELTREITEHSGFTPEQATDRIVSWLEELRRDGLVWMGSLSNAGGQKIIAAALTTHGREVVNT